MRALNGWSWQHRIPLGLLGTSRAFLRRLIQRTRAEQQQVQHTATMRVALLLVASAHAFVRPPCTPALQNGPRLPEMAGAIAKARRGRLRGHRPGDDGQGRLYGEEAVQRYNQYLFDPDGYSIIKMNEQIREAGFNSTSTSSREGPETWDKRQADLEADKQQKQNTSFIVVGRCWPR